ncbi:hypothetical protein VNO77_19691 [Canavalia gladiata]|uniref:Uncharacterized protein n=1 Tax=Canavalia gladiata TaxID=3824 RepID=A0AAN9QPV3_CANGL
MLGRLGFKGTSHWSWVAARTSISNEVVSSHASKWKVMVTNLAEPRFTILYPVSDNSDLLASTARIVPRIKPHWPDRTHEYICISTSSQKKVLPPSPLPDESFFPSSLLPSIKRFFGPQPIASPNISRNPLPKKDPLKSL